MPTTIPTKDDASIGRVKSNDPLIPITDLDVQYPAAEHERIKDYIIELATELGLTNGTTANSLRRGFLPTLLQLMGSITPAALAADTNDWAPTGFADATIIRVEATGALRKLSGIAGGTDGAVKILVNVGATHNVELLTESGLSTAANRIAGDRILRPRDGAILRYDGVSSRWRILASSNNPGEVNAVSAFIDSLSAGEAFLGAVEITSLLVGATTLQTSFDGGGVVLTNIGTPTAAAQAATKGSVDKAHPVAWVRKTATFTLDTVSRVILIDAAGALDCDLPDPASVAGVYWDILLQRDSPGDVTFDRFGSEKIQGLAADFVLTGGWSKLRLFCDGVDWFFI